MSTSLRRNPSALLGAGASLLFAMWSVINIEQQGLLFFAVCYALAFSWIAWHRPDIAMLLIFSIAPFQQDLGRGGLRFSLTEIHIALLLPIMILRNHRDHRPVRFGPILIPVLFYFGVCIYASLYNYLGRSTVISIAQMALYMVVVVGIFASFPDRVEQLRPSFYGLMAVGCFIASYSIITHNNFFLGLGKNGVGQSLSCAVLVCVEMWFAEKRPQRKVLLAGVLALLAAGLVFSVSRGAWAGCFMGLLLICGFRRQLQLMLVLGIVMAPMVALAWQYLPSETKNYASDFSAKRYNIQQRYVFIDTARKMWEESPIYGKGVGLRKEYDATNLAWSTLAETGTLGLIAIIWIHIAFFWTVFRLHPQVRRDSMHYSLLLIGGALLLRHLTHGMVDHYWSRGAVTLAWSGAGMVGYVYFVVKQEKHRRSLERFQEQSALLHAHAVPLNRAQHVFDPVPQPVNGHQPNGNGQHPNGHQNGQQSNGQPVQQGILLRRSASRRVEEIHRARLSRMSSPRRR